MLAAIVASLATVPFVYSFEKARAREPKPASAFVPDLAEGVAFATLISWGFVVLGLRLRTSLRRDNALVIAYWRRGLAAAMVCHFAADLVDKAILSLFGLA
jgi:short subunit dehydrogenase-like uncharacterized protein